MIVTTLLIMMIMAKTMKAPIVDHIDQFYPEVPLVIRFIFLTMTLTTMKLVATVIRIVLVMDLFGRDGDHDIDNNTTRPNLGPLSK